MGGIKGLAIGAAAVLILLVAVVLLRTAAVRPAATFASAGSAPQVDLAAAAGHLGQAVRFQTVGHQDPREDDPRAWDDLHAWLAATYPRLHAAAPRETVGGGALIWTWRGSDPALAPIILMAHQDVVPVAAGTRSAWRHPPFSGAMADGAVWGRGSLDDKGSLVATMEAGESLALQGFRPRRTIYIVSGHDEETTGAGASAIAATLAARRVHAEFALDEGSVVILDHPVTHGPAVLIGVAEKGYATLRVTARAAGGHSSAPPPSTAVTTLARAVLRIADRPFPLRYGGTAESMMNALAPSLPFASRLAVANAWLFRDRLTRTFAASPQGAAMLHTTIAPTMLEGSPKDNVLPDIATARINYRIAPGDTTPMVLALARAAVGRLPGVTLAIEPGARDPSPVSSSTSDAYRLIAGLAREASGAVPVAPSLVIAATDSRRLSGVARDVYRFQPIALRLGDTEMIHGVDEHLTIDNLSRMIVFYARLMRRAAG